MLASNGTPHAGAGLDGDAPDGAPHARPRGGSTVQVLRCTLALTLVLVASSLFTRNVNGALARDFGVLLELPGFCGAAGYLAIAALGYVRPQVLARRAVALGVGAGGSLGFGTLLASGAALGNAPLFVGGAALYSLVSDWVMFLFLCHLAHLGSLRAASVTVVGGVILRQLALPLFASSIGVVPGALACTCVLLATTVGLCVPASPPLFGRIERQEPLELLELTNPLSTLRPPPQLFGAVFLVAVTYGVSCAFGVPGMSARRIIVVLLLLSLLYLLLIQRERQEDRLFSLVELFVMAGLLLLALTLDGDTFLSNTFLFLASTCLDILVWLVMYGLAQRSVSVLVPTFGLVYGLKALGNCIGNAAGNGMLRLVETQPHGSLALVLGLAFFFFAFSWLVLRRFSFSEAIRGIEAIEGPAAEGAEVEGCPYSAEGDGGEGTEGFARAREQLAQTCGLTQREAEVFELLARGRNARYIMDELHITRNTAKAHIAHIYAKLGVHSHQELLTLVNK